MSSMAIFKLFGPLGMQMLNPTVVLQILLVFGFLGVEVLKISSLANFQTIWASGSGDLF